MNTIEKILLVDDDNDDQLLFAEALKDISTTTLCDFAFNGLDAFKYLEAATELPTLIFLDLNMPLMNGLQFLAKYQKSETFNNIPVIIFTTSNSQIDQQMTKKMGARLYITKPSDFKILKSKIREVLDLDFTRKELPVPFDL